MLYDQTHNPCMSSYEMKKPYTQCSVPRNQNIDCGCCPLSWLLATDEHTLLSTAKHPSFCNDQTLLKLLYMTAHLLTVSNTAINHIIICGPLSRWTDTRFLLFVKKILRVDIVSGVSTSKTRLLISITRSSLIFSNQIMSLVSIPTRINGSLWWVSHFLFFIDL